MNLSKEEKNILKKFVTYHKNTCKKIKDCDFCPFYNYVDDADACIIVQDFLDSIINNSKEEGENKK